jgi:hypothetical protein
MAASTIETDMRPGQLLNRKFTSGEIARASGDTWLSVFAAVTFVVAAHELTLQSHSSL